ncbi:MAG TPA: exodeoxyribonuclease VII large subunit, partial [Gammaproteobacteria bacterium]
MQVLVRARIALYEPRGDYQLIVEHMEEAGDGALRRAFEELKRRLNAEGLFDPARKRPLPAHPRQIGVITSPTGAALRDVLNVLRRRYPQAPIIIYPVQVQGGQAAADIVRTLALAGQRRECDVLLLVRGGGSLEDLQAFNDERVARAVVACEIPVVCGVGHEIDFTIADFAADLRAPTPSAAAELATPDLAGLQRHATQLILRMAHIIRTCLQRHDHHFQALSQRLQRLHPQQRLNQQNQRLDELEQRLQRAARHNVNHAATRLQRLEAALHAALPRARLAQMTTLQQQLSQRLGKAIKLAVSDRQRSLNALMRNLDTVSPLATLSRGYSIVTQPSSGKPVRDADEVKPGEKLDVRLAKGNLNVAVEKVSKK